MDRMTDRGFTIIELLLTLALSTVMMLGVSSLQIVAAKSNSTARAITEANSLAEDRLEAQMHATFGSFVIGGPVTESNLNAQGLVVTGPPAGPYTRLTTISAAPAPALLLPTPGAFRIVVQVRWTDSSTLAKVHQVQVTAVRGP